MTQPSKLEICQAVLRRSATIFVHLDPRKPGCAAPDNLSRQAQLVLQVGYNMPIPIEHLEVDHAGIRGLFSFRGVKEFCNVPWSCVFAIVGEDAQGCVFGDDVPHEVAQQLLQRSARSQAWVPEKPGKVVDLSTYRKSKKGVRA